MMTRVVGVGVRAIISRCIEENTSVIMDGVHLLPGFIDLSAFERKAIIARVSLNAPLTILIFGSDNPGIQFDVSQQVKSVSNMINVTKNFCLSRIPFRPVPFLFHIRRKRIGIRHAFGVASRSGIAIPVPGATNAITRFKHTDF